MTVQRFPPLCIHRPDRRIGNQRTFSSLFFNKKLNRPLALLAQDAKGTKVLSLNRVAPPKRGSRNKIVHDFIWRDDVALERKAKISIPAASCRVLRNFCFRPNGLKHRTFSLLRILIKFDFLPAASSGE
jgi:hypothetical protein